MHNKKLLSYTLLFAILITAFAPITVSQASGLDSIVSTLAAQTAPQDSSGGILNQLFSYIFDKLLGPILNIFGGGSPASNGNTPGKTFPPSSGSGPIADSGVVRGKVIVIDPGHGGSNPGAVGNGTRESDNNLAVGLKLRNKLTQAGATVIMSRDSDRTVAPEGNSLGAELQARVDLAESNHADMFVSVHSNSNPDASIAGAMTFYPSGKSSKLALEVQNSLIQQTGAIDKGVSPETFYVLRNTTMPSILVEMGFVSQQEEAARLQSDSYRNKVAQGIFNGIVSYFQKS